MPAEQTEPNYYDLLGLSPTASMQQIRRAYRELSKLYHPDTTELPAAIATSKFQALNEAYATLSNLERRAAYDLKLGYSRVTVIRPLTDLRQETSTRRKYRSSAYLDPSDRPLSAGELFALFILGVTFLGCLILVVAIGATRGEVSFSHLTGSPTAESVRVPLPELSWPDTLSDQKSQAPAPTNSPAPTHSPSLTGTHLPTASPHLADTQENAA